LVKLLVRNLLIFAVSLIENFRLFTKTPTAFLI